MNTITTTSWYKQFWPWFLIFLPGTAVVASVITIIIATKFNDASVIDDYYKAGLAINKTLDHIELAKRANITARLEYANTLLTANVTTTDASVMNDTDTLVLRFIHPTQRKQDINVQLKFAGPINSSTKHATNAAHTFKYIGQINTVRQANWYVQLEPVISNLQNNWRLDDRISINNVSQLNNYTLVAK